MSRLTPDVAGLVVVLWCAACATGRQPRHEFGPSDIRVITIEQIEASGARTVWEALQRTVTNYSFRDNGGIPTRIDHRGRSSVNVVERPQVVLDGVPLADLKVLAQIPASDLFMIEVLSGITATTYYGTNANKGVIRLHTR